MKPAVPPVPGRAGPEGDRRRAHVEAAERTIAAVERMCPGITEGRPPRGRCF